MKKEQLTITGLSEKELGTDPLSSFKTMGHNIPEYAVNCFASVRPEGVIKILFFEDPDDCMNQYIKFLLFRKKPNSVISYYTRVNSSSPWIKSPAPTVVSTHLETKLR